jgi:hypothetical protein
MASFVARNGNQSDMCCGEIKCAQNINTVLTSIVEPMEQTYVISQREKKG